MPPAAAVLPVSVRWDPVTCPIQKADRVSFDSRSLTSRAAFTRRLSLDWRSRSAVHPAWLPTARFPVALGATLPALMFRPRFCWTGERPLPQSATDPYSQPAQEFGPVAPSSTSREGFLPLPRT